MNLLNRHFWKFLAVFLILVGLGVAALFASVDYLDRNQTAGDIFYDLR